MTQEERLELLATVAGMIASHGITDFAHKRAGHPARPALEWVALAWVAIVAGAIGAFVCAMSAVGFLIEPLVGPALTAVALAALLALGSMALVFALHLAKQRQDRERELAQAATPDRDSLPKLVLQLLGEFAGTAQTASHEAMINAALAGFTAAINARHR